MQIAKGIVYSFNADSCICLVNSKTKRRELFMYLKITGGLERISTVTSHEKCMDALQELW